MLVKHGIRNTNFCSFDGGGGYVLLQPKGWTMLVQRSRSQAMAGRQHHAVKLGLRAKYKLPAAHHLLSSFAYGSAKSWVSGLTSKHSASFEDPVNIIYSIINFQINVYLFLDS